MDEGIRSKKSLSLGCQDRLSNKTFIEKPTIISDQYRRILLTGRQILATKIHKYQILYKVELRLLNNFITSTPILYKKADMTQRVWRHNY